ncbi:TolC family protein [Fulvivirga lutimaris]|uniref:TolC family protein n=1 Tax=Fulvivirga lutimaris TaxID=1819566 RepID=UPI0012BCC23A|nr:TolC family protein [Fulvivirga lutimaris]MTI41428.1 TolC family protein [Fulvivirga lutimaris]
MRIILTFIALFVNCIVVLAQGNLERYQQLALENNPEVQAKYKIFEAAMERTTQVNALPDPTLSIGYFISPVETRVGPQRAKISLSQMFPWFGSLRAQGDAAAVEAQVYYQQFLETQLATELKVAKAYFPLLGLESLKKIVEQNLGYLKVVKTVATSAYENGNVSLADVLRIDLNIKQVESRLKLLNDKEKPLKSVFNNVLNITDSFQIEYDSLSIPIFETAEVDFEGHPIIQELDYKQQAGEAKITAIEKSSLPKFGLGLDYVFVDERTDMNVADNGKNAFMPMVSFTLPIFRKKYKSAIQEVEFQNESFQLMETARINTLSSSFEELNYRILSENEKWRLYSDLEQQTLTINRLLLSEYENSGKNLNDLLLVQLQLLDYQEKKISASVNLNVSQAELDYLTKK